MKRPSAATALGAAASPWPPHPAEWSSQPRSLSVWKAVASASAALAPRPALSPAPPAAATSPHVAGASPAETGGASSDRERVEIEIRSRETQMPTDLRGRRISLLGADCARGGRPGCACHADVCVRGGGRGEAGAVGLEPSSVLHWFLVGAQVLADGELERAAVGQREDALDESLAKGRLAWRKKKGRLAWRGKRGQPLAKGRPLPRIVIHAGEGRAGVGRVGSEQGAFNQGHRGASGGASGEKGRQVRQGFAPMSTARALSCSAAAKSSALLAVPLSMSTASGFVESPSS